MFICEGNYGIAAVYSGRKGINSGETCVNGKCMYN